jgi:YqjK-like protein
MMHTQHHRALAQRRQLLLLQSARLRLSLVQQSQVLKRPLAVADQVRACVHWLGRHPVWPLMAVALWGIARPRSMSRGLSQLLAITPWLLRTWRKLRAIASPYKI